MASFLKKALGVFVEFDDDKTSVQNTSGNVSSPVSPNPSNSGALFNSGDMEKFEKHFSDLFEQANLPGPDYFEFWKMMESLETHIADENTRMSATFAALSVQGLTKEKLIETANKYKEVIENDKMNFEKVLNDTSKRELGDRQSKQKEYEDSISKNSDMIQKLTQQISEAQGNIAKLKTEIIEEQNKLNRNKNGYDVACEAMVSKISNDIKKIQTSL